MSFNAYDGGDVRYLSVGLISLSAQK